MLLNCGIGENSLRVPWTARRSNQPILKEIRPEYSLEGLMMKLKLQYFGHLLGRTVSLEKLLMLGKIEGRRRRGWQKMRWLDGNTDSMGIEFEQTPAVGDGQGGLACCSPWDCRVGHDWVNWTELCTCVYSWSFSEADLSYLSLLFYGTWYIQISLLLRLFWWFLFCLGKNFTHSNMFPCTKVRNILEFFASFQILYLCFLSCF